MKEDIKILETLKESYIKASECGLGYPSDNREDKRIAQALENLIKGYRELEEQIDKHVYFETTNPKEIEKNFIPKSKIKEKIEELDRAYKDSLDENGESIYYYPDYTINILQELLGDEE